jgi:DinB superfamily
MKHNIPVSISERLKTQHLSITAGILHLDAFKLIIKPKPDKWSIRDNMAHLARYQKIFNERIDKILITDTPVFEPYKAENDTQFEKWMQKNPEALLIEINSDRIGLIQKLESLTETDLQKAGIHSSFGRLNILEWTEFFLLHEAHHLFTIFKLAHSDSI